jgi:hypothetical protein
MADFSKPALTDTYANFLAFLSSRINDVAVSNDPAKTTVTNPITNMIRWNSANAYWEIYSGSSWSPLAGTYNINITGNSGTATKWATGRTVTLTGDATGVSSAFDGSGNLSFATTLATVNSNTGAWGSASSVPQITLDGKGRATAAANVSISIAWSQISSGKPTDLAGYGITDAPTKTGTGASGSWNINAATASAASALKSATTTIDTVGATAPSAGQILTAVDSTHAVWQAPSGGGQLLGSAATKAIAFNAQVIAEDLTIAAGTNGLSAGPITVNNGFAVTVSNGSTWSIV